MQQMEVSVTGDSTRTRMGLGAAWVIAIALLGAVLYWQFKPWASDEEKSRLADLRDQLTTFYQTHPPVPSWHILGIEVAPPGLVVSLDMPSSVAEGLQRRPAVYRLQAAGAICPEPNNPIYTRLGRFSMEIHPMADGKPVLVNADCRKVRVEPETAHGT